MNQETLNWYKDKRNGFPVALMSVVEKTISQIEQYYKLSFEEMFISNEKNDGHEEYPSLLLFSEQDVVECNLLEEVTDIARYKENIRWVQVTVDNRKSLLEPSTESTMELNGCTVSGVSYRIKATGLNCQNLNKIAQQFFYNNIV